MSNSIKTLDKLIDVKDREKLNILNHYNHLKEQFEKAAQKLLDLIGKEEIAKERLNELIQKGTVSDIQKQNQFIKYLEPLIQEQENIYKHSRDALHIEKLKLVDKNVEIKKIERVKDKKIEVLLQLEKEKASKEMDEISINQFMKSKVMA